MNSSDQGQSFNGAGTRRSDLPSLVSLKQLLDETLCVEKIEWIHSDL